MKTKINEWHNWQIYWKQMKENPSIRLEWALKLDQASIHSDGTLCYVDNNCPVCLQLVRAEMEKMVWPE